MEKCSLVEYKEIDAIYFCDKCKIYMCYKCEKFHSELFKNHHQKKCNESKGIEDIFIGLCTEENHLVDLQYFCKTHNILCCAKCITKIKSKENGQHINCDIFLIENIKNEKKLKLKQNIIFVHNLSINIEQIINDIKKISEKVTEKKEELKTSISKIFTKLRNALNNREDVLLLEVDKKYSELYYDEELMKKYEKLPNKIKYYLEKGKLIENNLESNINLNKLINDCIIIENVIDDINKIKEKIKNYNLENNKYEFLLIDNIEKRVLELIKKLGKISKKESISIDNIYEKFENQNQILNNNEKNNISIHFL